MRSCSFLLICCLWIAHPVRGAEFFGELLYWKATEPVDWVLNADPSPANQFVDYVSTDYDFVPGFRLGATLAGHWEPQIAWTHFETSTDDSIAGDLTAAFLGGKDSQPPAPKLYFDTGQLAASIDYDMIDLDVGKSYEVVPSMVVRPVVGLRGGTLRQSFITAFQTSYTHEAVASQRNVVETAESNFWGIGPKMGVDSHVALYRSRLVEVNLQAGFFAAYLLGDWDLPDVTRITQTDDGVATDSTQTIKLASRDFGSLAFQAMVGMNFRAGHWSGAVGYELNDWLNQCQVFTDATGPQNNDLLLQGLNVRLAYEF
nr:Lpg1974 family pore-forming outer membrane protein [Aeoliella straminimaris]